VNRERKNAARLSLFLECAGLIPTIRGPTYREYCDALQEQWSVAAEPLPQSPLHSNRCSYLICEMASQTARPSYNAQFGRDVDDVDRGRNLPGGLSTASSTQAKA
jgi:hypothetical protein